jgi:membrane-bound serine protease (ClpP class)
LKINGQTLKEKGELLSLTATEAMKAYGHPPRPLLGAGIARDLDSLLIKRFGAGGCTQQIFKPTWSEELAVVLNRIAPVLMGLGLLALFVAFKTGGFGAIGFAGVALLGIVFLSHYVAGLSGHEPVLLFALGIILLALEMVFFHTAGFLGVMGVALILGSLVWSMADLWPNEPITVAWSSNAFAWPLLNLAFGLAIAAVAATALLRFLPHGWLWDRMVIGATIGGSAQSASSPPGEGPRLDALIGRRGVAATALRPGGQIEIEGRRYEAQVELGTLEAGAAVVVRRRSDFGLVVERAE